MTHRMVTATLALVGLLLAVYLWLWRMGWMGALACGAGGCETVQLSEHATFLGMPVAFHGVVGYALIVGVSLVGLSATWMERREPTIVLAILSGIGVLFTAYLTYLEAFVIEAWCRWCLVSAGIIVAIFIASLLGLKGR